MAPSEYSHIYSSAYTECPPRAHHWDGNREQWTQQTQPVLEAWGPAEKADDKQQLN